MKRDRDAGPRRLTTTLTHAESLEPRAMLAGVGPETWSSAGLATAPQVTGDLSPSGILLTCSSPPPGSSGSASPPAAAAGSADSPSDGGLWLPITSGSGDVFGSTGTRSITGVVTNGPALSSQTTGNAGGQSVGTTTGATTSSGALWLSSTSGSGSSSSGCTGGVITNGPALSSQTTGGTIIGGQDTSLAAGVSVVGRGDHWLSYTAGSGTGNWTSGTTGGMSKDGPALSSQSPGGSITRAQGSDDNKSGTPSGSDLWFLYGSGLGAGSTSSGTTDSSLADLLVPLSQHMGDSNADSQGHEASEPLKDADLWTYYGRGSGEGTADGSLAYALTPSDPYTGGSGIGRLTPLVHQFGSTDGPGFASGAWTSDEGGTQFVLAGDPESEEGVRRTLSYEEAYDIWPMEQEEYERQEREGLWDVTDSPKPKDEFASIPTDENGNYSWKTIQDFKDFIGRTVQLGKDFAWHMAEWFGPDEIAKAAKPLVAGGKNLAVIGFGAGKADDVDDVARAARNGKLPRWDGKKPSYTIHPDHAPGTLKPGKTPLPDDAGEVFRHAVPDSDLNARHWYGKNAEGKIYRFSNSNDGTVHFSGIDGVGDGIRNITEYARRRLMEMSR